MISPGWYQDWAASESARRQRNIAGGVLTIRPNNFPTRRVWGSGIHTPLGFAARKPRGGAWVAPWLSEAEGLSPTPAVALRRSLYSTERPFGNTGLGDWISEIEIKLAGLVTKAQTMLGKFLQAKGDLLDAQKNIDKAIARARARGLDDRVPRLLQLRAESDRLLASQASIQVKVLDAQRKISDAKTALGIDSGVGVLPLVAIGVVALAAAAIAATLGYVTVHLADVLALREQLALAASGVLTPEEIERIKRKETDGFSFSGLAAVAAVAGAAWLVWRR